MSVVSETAKCVQDWKCEGADPIAYAGWKGENPTTVGEVEEFFARACHECRSG